MSEYLVNEHIRARTVRIVDDETAEVIPTHEAMSRARNSGLDLVMVAAGEPPICRIVDADRFRYERKKSEREQAKRQRELAVDTKEIQLRPVTDNNDVSIKAKRARGFLEQGDKVKVVVRFRGRERSHKEWGHQMIDRFLSQIGEHKVDKALSEGESDLTIILGSMISKSDAKSLKTIKA